MAVSGVVLYDHVCVFTCMSRLINTGSVVPKIYRRDVQHQHREPCSLYEQLVLVDIWIEWP